MNGKTVKYHFYKKYKQSNITIPVSLAQSLNWKDKDEIKIIIETVNGQIGLFLFKEVQ